MAGGRQQVGQRSVDGISRPARFWGLSQAEFKKIKSVLGEKLQDELGSGSSDDSD
jgi:hypothetical protein